MEERGFIGAADSTRVERKIDRLTKLVRALLTAEIHIMALIDDVLDDVAELPTISDSLDKLFAALAPLIASGDPVKLKQAKDMIDTFKDRTKAAIVANTPAATPPTT